MINRRRRCTIAHLIAAITVLAPTGIVRGQPSEEGDDRAAVYKRLILDVEARKRVLVRSRGELIAVSAAQVGQLFASRVLTGDMPPDSIVPMTLRVREMSDFYLQQLKRELEGLAATGVRLRWNGAPGIWALACTGRYPPEVNGTVDQIYMERPPSGSRNLHVGLYRGHAFATALSGTVIDSRAHGSQRFEMPGDDFSGDVGTLVWDVEVTEASPAGDGVPGTIVANGPLTYTGNEGSCRGSWHSP